MSLEGDITLEVSRDGLIAIRPRTLIDIAPLLAGKTAGETKHILPMIFSLCGQAHACASARAQQASLELNAQNILWQNLVVLAENAREHILRIFTGWSDVAEAGALQAPISDIMNLVPSIRTIAGDRLFSGQAAGLDRKALVAVEAAVCTLERFLRDYILGHWPGDWLAMHTTQDIEVWSASQQTTAACYLDFILTRGWASVGAATPGFLPDIDGVDFRDILLDQAGFTARPHKDGHVYETGCYARQARRRLMQAAISRYGPGLLARSLSRLVELARIPQEMRKLIQKISSGAEADRAIDTTEGLGMIETARGRLYHACRTCGGRIVDYKILAPTEWNFHPQGVAAKCLNAMNDNQEEPESVRQKAEMLIMAVDPCVHFEVRVA